MVCNIESPPSLQIRLCHRLHTGSAHQHQAPRPPTFPLCESLACCVNGHASSIAFNVTRGNYKPGVCASTWSCSLLPLPILNWCSLLHPGLTTGGLNPRSKPDFPGLLHSKPDHNTFTVCVCMSCPLFPGICVRFTCISLDDLSTPSDADIIRNVLLPCTCNMPGQHFVLSIRFYWLHQHNLYTCAWSVHVVLT